MPTFQYEAMDEKGQPKKGTISANTSDEAIQRIRGQGYFPTSVREAKAKKSKSGSAAGGGSTAKAASGGGKGGAKKMSEINITIPGFGGVGAKDLTLFTRQLSTLQDAGLPILRSLAILEQQQKPGTLKRTLTQVHDDVSAGSPLSDAFAKHPKAFDKLYTKMIQAGEVGGVLDLILERLAQFLEKSQQLKAKIKSAMIYPVAVILIASFIVLGIMLFIVPSFIKIFEDFDTKMPLMTLYLIEFSKWLSGPLLGYILTGAPANEEQMIPGIFIVVFIPFIAFFGWKLMRKISVTKAATDIALLYLPVVGGLIRKTTIARFTRTLGTLIHAGVPILDAITITSETTGNYKYTKALQAVHDSVRQGDSFAEPLRKAKVCDALVTNMIDVGEETGDLDKMLLKIADNYDDEVDNAVAGLVSLLEPFMVVILGVIVGGIVIALFLPMISLMQSVM